MLTDGICPSFSLRAFHSIRPQPEPTAAEKKYKRRVGLALDTSGMQAMYDHRQPAYPRDATLDEVDAAHKKHVALYFAALEEAEQTGAMPLHKVLLTRASLLHSQGKAAAA